MGKIESWRNKKILISQEDYDKLEEDEKEGKYSSEKIESYFTLFELLLAPKSNPLLAVEELCFAKQGSMDSGEFHAHVVKIAKRCKFPCAKAKLIDYCVLKIIRLASMNLTLLLPMTVFVVQCDTQSFLLTISQKIS